MWGKILSICQKPLVYPRTAISFTHDVDSLLIGLNFKSLQLNNAKINRVNKSNSLMVYIVSLESKIHLVHLIKRIQIWWFFSPSPLVMYPDVYNWRITSAIKLKFTCSEDKTDCEFHTTNTKEFCEDSFGISYLTIAAVFCKDEGTSLPAKAEQVHPH